MVNRGQTGSKMLECLGILLKPHEPPTQGQCGPAGAERSSKRIQHQVTRVGTVFYEFLDELFGQLVVVADFPGLVLSRQWLHTESIVVTVGGVVESTVSVERAALSTSFWPRPEQHMVVAADPFLFGIHAKTVLGYDVVDLLQVGGMQRIEHMVEIAVAGNDV